MLCPPTRCCVPARAGASFLGAGAGRWPRGSGCQSGRESHHDLCGKEWIGRVVGMLCPLCPGWVLFEVSRMFPKAQVDFPSFSVTKCAVRITQGCQGRAIRTVWQWTNCGSLIVSWSPEAHQPGVAGQSARGTAHDLHWLVTRLGLGRQEVHLEVRLQSNCLRILAAPCPNTLHLGSEATPHACPGWPSKAASSQLSAELKLQSSRC